MLRMGRSPKAESNEAAAAQQAPPAQAQPPQAPPAQAYPYQPQPAANAYEQPARSAPTPATPSAPRAVTESEALARDLREGVVSGFVGAGTSVSGDAEFKGMLRIDGRFTGRVRSEKGSLIVSAGGVVEANVEVASAKINGTVRGDIYATGRVEFGRSARVYGNIQTPALVIEDGAIFEGNCRMQTQPEAARTPKAEATKAEATRPAATQPKPPAAKPAQATPAPAGNGAARAAAVTPATSPEPTA